MIGSIDLSCSVSETCFVFPSAVCFIVFALPPLKISTYLLVAQQLLRYTCGMFRRVKTHVCPYTSFHFSEWSFTPSVEKYLCIFGQGDLFANNILESIRFKLLMVIWKSLARFDMVWTGWTSLACFLFCLKVKRLASSLWLSSAAIRSLIRVWLMHDKRRILLICFLNEEITDQSVGFDTEATSGDIGAVKQSVNLNCCHYAILLKD